MSTFVVPEEDKFVIWGILQSSLYIPELARVKPDFNPRILYDSLISTISEKALGIEIDYTKFEEAVEIFRSTSGTSTDRMNAVMSTLGVPEDQLAETYSAVRESARVPLRPLEFMAACTADGIPTDEIQNIVANTSLIERYTRFMTGEPKPSAAKPAAKPTAAAAKKTVPAKTVPAEAKVVSEVAHNEPALTLPVTIPDIERLLVELQRFVMDNGDELYNALSLAVYKGFNREAILSEAFRSMSAQAIFVVAAVTALRGPKAVKTSTDIQQIRVSDINGRNISIAELYTQGILKEERATFKKGGRDLAPNELTAGRICAAFPDMAAYGLWLLWKRGSLTKRVDVACPAFLQFPQGAALPMSEIGRAQHVDFSKRFSDEALKPAGGSFNKNIYAQQSRNVVSLDNALGQVLVADSNGVLSSTRNFPYVIVEGTSESKASDK